MMMMMSALYRVNIHTCNWIFIVLPHRNNSSKVDIALLGHIILILNQPVFDLTLKAASLAEKQQIVIL